MKPTTINIRGREIPVCQHGDCEDHCVWDYPTCWEHLTSDEKTKFKERISQILRTNKNLSGLVLTGAELQSFDFSGVDMSDTFIDQCNLSNAKFVETNLSNAYLGWSNLENADLIRAELDGAVFTKANLFNIKLVACSMSFGRVPVNITKNSFKNSKLFKRPKVDESDPYPVEATYRALKAQFIGVGDYDSASWAAYCERLMQRKKYWKFKNYFKWLSSLIFGSISGYGEKPLRIFWLVLSIISLYSFLFFISGVLLQSSDKSVSSLSQSIYFSATTFCTMTVPGLEIKQTLFGMFLVSSEAFLGLISLSLVIFTLTRRYVAR
jgi:uncharacterized protein YjbI with pentapeptide repeats